MQQISRSPLIVNVYSIDIANRVVFAIDNSVIIDINVRSRSGVNVFNGKITISSST